MAYKYEGENIRKVRLYNVMTGSSKKTKPIKELEEVYAKAKAWDNYLADVENSIREITDNEDEVKWHVDYAINEYMEDK
ncbi:hypothetical protein [Mammaliicoccus sciuri]|uniref:Phage protein n=1 Tax=Mammaliicoccus sciuri TaxID=1296 RepID=A0AAW5LQI8_MAMSC|nr:hypothetical protein [Mammaliicoccus sciuri]MCQ9304985.1 hypothetical protein [Mammaliicoccus sciuri]